MTPEQKRRSELRMARFDRLPKSVRRALSEANYDWSETEVARSHRLGAKARDLANNIRANDHIRRKQREEAKCR